MNEPIVVSPEMRQAHSKAIRNLHKWKMDYREVSNAIRTAKWYLRNTSDDRFWQLSLRALRGDAFALMEERTWLKGRLRNTAYRYAPREMVEAIRRIG